MLIICQILGLPEIVILAGFQFKPRGRTFFKNPRFTNFSRISKKWKNLQKWWKWLICRTSWSVQKFSSKGLSLQYFLGAEPIEPQMQHFEAKPQIGPSTSSCRSLPRTPSGQLVSLRSTSLTRCRTPLGKTSTSLLRFAQSRTVLTQQGTTFV